MNVQTALNYFLAAKTSAKSPRTVYWYRDCLRHMVNHVGKNTLIESVTTHDLRCWINHHLADEEVKLSPWTLNSFGRAARGFFAWLVEEDIIEKNPALRLDLYPLPKGPRKGICERDRDAMLNAARDNPRDYALLRFAAATGARESGIAGLTVGDLDIEARRAYVHEKGCGGNQKCRPVFFDLDTAEAIRAWLVI